MPAPVRFPNGVTNVGPTDPMGQLSMPDPTRIHAYFNDFDTYNAADWTLTETSAGATQAVRGTVAGGNGGILDLTQNGAGGATDVNQLQLANETFLITPGKQLWFKSRFAATAGTMANFGILMGLTITDTTAVAGVSDGIFFRKQTGVSTLEHVLCFNAAETTTGALATVTTATFLTAGFYYNGKDAVEVYVNDVKVATHTTLTNLVQDEELAVTIASVNATAAAANLLACDYIFAAMDR